MLEGTRSPHPIEIVWEGGKRYRGGLPNGPTLVLDGDRQAAPSPVDSLLVALGTCSAIDVVEVLGKRRTPASSLTVHVDFSRAVGPPRRLTEAHLRFRVATDSDPHHVERAIQLSFGKYCSVAATFAPDTRFTWSVEVIPPDAGTAPG
jgi:putative redox protein